MVGLENIFVISSVLFLVVIEISGRFRELDIEGAARRSASNDETLPNLGIFSLIHGLNAFLLVVGFMLVVPKLVSNFDVSVLLLAILYMVLAGLLPYLEVKNYEAHLLEHDSWTSFHFHLLFTVLAFVLFPIELVLLASFAQPEVARTVGALLFTVIIFIGILGFLSVFQDELVADSDQG